MLKKHIEDNKKTIELEFGKTTITDIINKILEGLKVPLLMEPPNGNKNIGQYVSRQPSVHKSLKALNNFRVIYTTPYRFFQDFDYTYLLGSSRKGLKKPEDKYDDVFINVKDIKDAVDDDAGFIDDGDASCFEIQVNYADVKVFDNTIVNKSRSKLQTRSEEESKEEELQNKSEQFTKNAADLRLNNNNTDMQKNIKAEMDNSNFFIFFNKRGLDNSILTINKKIKVKMIDRYSDADGDYLLQRKRELYLREDNRFILFSEVNLRRIG